MKKTLQLSALAFALTLASQAAAAWPNFTPTQCGDPCSVEGAEHGCSCFPPGGVAYRTICTCINGRWVG